MSTLIQTAIKRRKFQGKTLNQVKIFNKDSKKVASFTVLCAPWRLDSSTITQLKRGVHVCTLLQYIVSKRSTGN